MMREENKPVDVTKFNVLFDKGDNVERCLAIMWLDAHDRLWPKENAGQRMYLVESALENYLKRKSRQS